MTSVFYLFVKQGFLTPWIEDKFSLNYILQLKYEMFPKNKNMQKLPPRDLIKIAWSLMVMQRPGKVSNPLLPNVISQLHKFDRPNMPLTNEELIMLYQLDVYIRDMVSRGSLPPQFATMIPEKIRRLSAKLFQEWENETHYTAEQNEIANILLKLRARFTKDCTPLNTDLESSNFDGVEFVNSYKVPIRLDDP